LRILLVLVVWILCVSTAIAQLDPRPPCGDAPAFPDYAPLGHAPNYRVWSKSNASQVWQPPACTGWPPKDRIVVVAVAGQFRHQGSTEGLLLRFGPYRR
jgi:hypothetical protein